MSEKIYKLRYTLKLEPGQFKKADVRNDTEGLSDAVVVISILNSDDGWSNYAFFSKDGETRKELSPKEMFKAWILLAEMLIESKDLDETRKFLVRAAADMWRYMLGLPSRKDIDPTKDQKC